MSNLREIQDFAKRFLKKVPALAYLPANAQAIDETLRKGVLLVIESTSGAVIMGRYAPEKRLDSYWLALEKCVRKDFIDEDNLASYRISIEAVKELYYVKEI